MQDKFYKIEPAVGTKETGIGYPAAKMISGYSFSAPDSVHRINNYSIPDFTPNISFELSKGSNLCDVMTEVAMPGIGFLISEKLKLFLQNFNLGQHQFFKGKIKDNHHEYDYYWLHLIWNNRHEIVDFSNSSFYKEKHGNNLGELIIDSIEDYKKVKKEIGSKYIIGFDYLSILHRPQFDLWPIPFRGSIIISEKLKKAIENTGFSGIDISENHLLHISLQA